jgi:hypothetical protein
MKLLAFEAQQRDLQPKVPLQRKEAKWHFHARNFGISCRTTCWNKEEVDAGKAGITSIDTLIESYIMTGKWCVGVPFRIFEKGVRVEALLEILRCM